LWRRRGAGAATSPAARRTGGSSIDGMKAVSLTWVDAFTKTPFAGNPAGVCLLDEAAPAGEMQALATELGIAETAFVVPGEAPDSFGLRWFSPQVEIDLCGHATLATAHALRAQGVVDGLGPITFSTRSGPLIASFAGDLIELDFPADVITAGPLPSALAEQWGEGVVVAAGTTAFFTVVTVADEDAVRHYRPDLEAIAAVGSSAVLLMAAADPGSGADYVLRVFAPNVGIDEDPATGSAQCVAGPYWAAALGRPELVARQLSSRGATFYVRPEGSRVHIGGHAVSVFTGHLSHDVHDVTPTAAAPSVQVRRIVASHRAVSPREVAAKARFLAALELLGDPYDEHADPTHVTASAVVVGQRGTVLHLHKRLGRWMQPGGHIDPGEEPPVAALREAIEELGLAVSHPEEGPQLINVDVHEAALGHTHLDLRYLLFAPADDPHPPPGESPEARWFDWDEASAAADDALAPALVIAREAWEAWEAREASLAGAGRPVVDGKRGEGR
jgi:PhzF family phenazine biosynthesis protein